MKRYRPNEHITYLGYAQWSTGPGLWWGLVEISGKINSRHQALNPSNWWTMTKCLCGFLTSHVPLPITPSFPDRAGVHSPLLMLTVQYESTLLTLSSCLCAGVNYFLSSEGMLALLAWLWVSDFICPCPGLHSLISYRKQDASLQLLACMKS